MNRSPVLSKETATVECFEPKWFNINTAQKFNTELCESISYVKMTIYYVLINIFLYVFHSSNHLRWGLVTDWLFQWTIRKLHKNSIKRCVKLKPLFTPLEWKECDLTPLLKKRRNINVYCKVAQNVWIIGYELYGTIIANHHRSGVLRICTDRYMYASPWWLLMAWCLCFCCKYPGAKWAPVNRQSSCWLDCE